MTERHLNLQEYLIYIVFYLPYAPWISLTEQFISRVVCVPRSLCSHWPTHPRVCLASRTLKSARSDGIPSPFKVVKTSTGEGQR
jgi:hypothetical protein